MVISLLVNLSVADAFAIERPMVVVAPASPPPPRALRPASESAAAEVASTVRVRMGAPPRVSLGPHSLFTVTSVKTGYDHLPLPPMSYLSVRAVPLARGRAAFGWICRSLPRNRTARRR